MMTHKFNRSRSRYRLIVENIAPGTNWQVRTALLLFITPSSLLSWSLAFWARLSTLFSLGVLKPCYSVISYRSPFSVGFVFLGNLLT